MLIFRVQVQLYTICRAIIEKSSIKIDVVLSYCRGTLNDNALGEYIPFFQVGISYTTLKAFISLILWLHPKMRKMSAGCSFHESLITDNDYAFI